MKQQKKNQEIKEEDKFTQIYLVTNCYEDSNKVYIGKEKSSRKGRRKKEHIKIFGHQVIFTYIDKIEGFNKEGWKPLECFWIEQFRQWGFELMNKNKGGGGADFQTEESNNKRRNALKNKPNLKNKKSKPSQNKPVLQYDLEGNFIREWVSLNEANIHYGRGMVGMCCRNKLKTTVNFIWRFKTSNIFPLKIESPILFTLQYNINGDFIKKWNNQVEIFKELNIKTVNISNCIKGRQKTAGGYIWKKEKL